MYANDDYYGQHSMTGTGEYDDSPYGAALQPDAPTEPDQASQEDSTSEPVDSGLLMSFLTDFRTAHYEEIRRQRMEELEKTRKGRSNRPVPRREEPDDASFEEPYSEDYPDTCAEEAEAEPSADAPDAAAPETPDGISEADFQVAACQPEEHAAKRRLGLRLPGFKNLGQSPATA